MNLDSGQLAIGCQFGRFRIIRFLGKGGMGEVYEAEHEDLGSSFAIKLINQDIMNDAGVQLRFKHEARTNFGLKHRNIVSVDDCNEVEGKYYIRMQLVRGTQVGDQNAVNLDEYLALRGGRLPENEVAQILKDILTGLHEAHERGIIHRDLKPANILMENGKALLSDFGLAKLVGEEFFQSRIRLSIEESKTIVRSGDKAGSGMGSLEASYVGTYDFMAPEVKSGDDATTVSDLFAVGLIAYQLLTGKKSLGLKKPSQIVPGINLAWDDWIAGATEYDAALRTKSASELLRTLPLLGEAKPKKRSKRVFFSGKALFLYLLLAASGCGYYFYTHKEEYPLVKEKVEYLTDLAHRIKAAVAEEPMQPVEPVVVPDKAEPVVVAEPQGEPQTVSPSEEPSSPVVQPKEAPLPAPAVVENLVVAKPEATPIVVVPQKVVPEPQVAAEPPKAETPATVPVEQITVAQPQPAKVAPEVKAFGYPERLDLVLPNGMMVNFVLCESRGKKYYISSQEVSEELFDYVVVKRDGMKNSPSHPVRLYEVGDLSLFFDHLNQLNVSQLQPIGSDEPWLARLPSVSEWMNLYQQFKDHISLDNENVGGGSFTSVAGDGSYTSPILHLIGNASEICVLDNYVKLKALRSDHLRAYGLSFGENYTSDFYQYGRRLPADRDSMWRVYGFRILIEPKANTNK